MIIPEHTWQQVARESAEQLSLAVHYTHAQATRAVSALSYAVQSQPRTWLDKLAQVRVPRLIG